MARRAWGRSKKEANHQPAREPGVPDQRPPPREPFPRHDEVLGREGVRPAAFAPAQPRVGTGQKRHGHDAALAGVLTGHFVLGFVWLVVFLSAVFLTSSETGAADLVLLVGCLCWLVALPIIIVAWRSGSHWYWSVPFAWVIVFAIAAVVAVSASVRASTSAESGPPPSGTACPKRSPSADGARPHVAGAPHRASLIAFVSDRDGDLQIYVMHADGSDQRRLTRNETGGSSPAWSPDGTKIAFTRPCSYGNGRYDSEDEIFVMNADGSGQRNLSGRRSNDESPAWTPDGTRIAFVSDRGQGQALGWSIVVMNADGSRQRVIARNASRFSHPTWSPNGRQIAFVGNGYTTIYVMNSDGSGQRRVTDTQADSEDPAWSPVANTIAYKRSFSDADDAIYTMSPDAGTLRRLTHEDAAAPAWSPDGTKIAFASGRDGDAYELYMMNADGSGQTRLTHNSATDTDPSWQPTSRRRLAVVPPHRVSQPPRSIPVTVNSIDGVSFGETPAGVYATRPSYQSKDERMWQSGQRSRTLWATVELRAGKVMDEISYYGRFHTSKGDRSGTTTLMLFRRHWPRATVNDAPSLGSKYRGRSWNASVRTSLRLMDGERLNVIAVFGFDQRRILRGLSIVTTRYFDTPNHCILPLCKED